MNDRDKVIWNALTQYVENTEDCEDTLNDREQEELRIARVLLAEYDEKAVTTVECTDVSKLINALVAIENFAKRSQKHELSNAARYFEHVEAIAHAALRDRPDF